MTTTARRSVLVDALTSVPRVDADTWRGLGPGGRWLVASRAAVLVMTLLSAMLAGILAWADGRFQPLPFILTAVGLLAAHAANNLLNDLIDHVRGTDRGDTFRTRYGTQPLEAGLLSRRSSLVYASVPGVVALACGAWLAALRGPVVWLLVAVGAVFVVGYTWPLKSIGLGEPAVLVVWGPLMVGGGYLTTTGVWSTDAAVASLPYALGVTAVLFGKHLDKLDQDRTRGVRTLPVILGASAARRVTLTLVGLQYAIALGLVATGGLGWPVLAVLGAAPLLRWVWLVFTNPTPDEPPEGYPASAWPLWYVSFAFVHNRRFGALYLGGIAVWAALERLT